MKALLIRCRPRPIICLYARSVLGDGAVRSHKRVILGATERRKLVVHVRVAGLHMGRKGEGGHKLSETSAN